MAERFFLFFFYQSFGRAFGARRRRMAVGSAGRALVSSATFGEGAAFEVEVAADLSLFDVGGEGRGFLDGRAAAEEA